MAGKRWNHSHPPTLGQQTPAVKAPAVVGAGGTGGTHEPRGTTGTTGTCPDAHRGRGGPMAVAFRKTRCVRRVRPTTSGTQPGWPRTTRQVCARIQAPTIHGIAPGNVNSEATTKPADATVAPIRQSMFPRRMGFATCWWGMGITVFITLGASKMRSFAGFRARWQLEANPFPDYSMAQ